MNKVIIVTDSFSLNLKNNSHILSEIENLKENYEIEIISTDTKERYLDNKNKFDFNEIKISKVIYPKFNFKNKIFIFWKCIVSKNYYKNIFSSKCSLKKIKIKSIEFINLHLKAYYFYNYLKKNNYFDEQRLNNVIFYSLGSNSELLALCMAKNKNRNIKIISYNDKKNLTNENNIDFYQLHKKNMNDLIDCELTYKNNNLNKIANILDDLNKIKVCHVTSAHNRYDGRIFLKQCISLSKKYDVTLLCSDTQKNEIKNNIKIVSINKKFKTIFERLFLTKKYLKKKCLEINADIYEFHDPELLSLAKYMKKIGKKVIFDSHEDYKSLFDERKWIPNFLRKIMSTIYSKYEKSVLKNVDYILCAADHIKERLVKINKNCQVIPNFPIYEDVKKVSNNNTNNKNKIFTICFAGSIDSEWNHDIVVKAIQNIENVRYLIIGNCSADYQKELKSIDKNNKIEFLGKLKYEEVKEMYRKSDIGIALCSYRPNVNFKNGSIGNTKIFEFMMFGLPVILTKFEVFEKINKEKQFGISVNPKDVKEVEEAILKMINDKKMVELYGKNGKELIKEKYNWNNTEKLLFNVYSNLE